MSGKCLKVLQIVKFFQQNFRIIIKDELNFVITLLNLVQARTRFWRRKRLISGKRVTKKRRKLDRNVKPTWTKELGLGTMKNSSWLGLRTKGKILSTTTGLLILSVGHHCQGNLFYVLNELIGFIQQTIIVKSSLISYILVIWAIIL